MTQEEVKLKIARALEDLSRVDEALEDVLDRGATDPSQRKQLTATWVSVLAALRDLSQAQAAAD